MIVSIEKVRDTLNTTYNGKNSWWKTHKGSVIGLYTQSYYFHLGCLSSIRNRIMINYLDNPHQLRLSLI